MENKTTPRRTKKNQEPSIPFPIENIESKVVRKSNSLVEARYKLTLGEQRILYLLASAISPSDDEFKKYRISIRDLADMFSIPYSGELIDQVMDSLERLRIRKFQPYEDDLKAKYGKNSRAIIGWIDYAEYRNGESAVDIKFNERLQPYYLKLKERFTQIPFNVIVYFKSHYAIRFYEMVKEESYKADKNGYFKRSFEYEELRYKFLVEDSEYKYFKDFRVYVIEPAVREINESSDISIFQVDYAKTGRKFSHIVFHCQKKEQKKLLKHEKDDSEVTIIEQEKKPKEAPKDVQEMVSMGIDEATAYKWRKKYGVKQVNRNLSFTRAMQKAGKIKQSVTGFLCTAIADNLGGSWEFEEEEKEKKRKAREQAERIQEQEQQKIQAQEKKARQALLEDFHSLPEAKQESFRLAYEQQIQGILLKFWQRAKAKNPQRPEMESSVKVAFLAFYETNRNAPTA